MGTVGDVADVSRIFANTNTAAAGGAVAACGHAPVRLGDLLVQSSWYGAHFGLDEDRSGKLSRVEMLRVLMSFNLTGIREKVMDKLCEIIDKDGDGVADLALQLPGTNTKFLKASNLIL